MNPCEAYMTVQRGGNGLQDDDYLTMHSKNFYAGEEEPIYDVVH